MWLPLDPMDYIFLGGSPNMSTGVLPNLDSDLLNNYLRNQIWISYNGVATTDKFRVIVKYGVEYVPTG